MDKSISDGKSNAFSDNVSSQKGKTDSTCKKEVQHSRANKESCHTKHHIRGTASQSTIEYAKCGEQTKTNPGQRSKSFLEESALSKATSSVQGNQCCKRGTQGSHGDGLVYPVTSSNGKRSLLTDLPEKSEDVFKKSQIHKYTPQNNTPGVITQRLFESPLSFADLVRKGPAVPKSADSQQIQLNNSLLSTPQGSTEVSNYLNKYRSYLDNLRKTYGKGNHRFRLTELRSAATVHPRVFPITHMIHDLSDVSKDDPDFQQLLEKTTTESIRNLWPQTPQSRAQYNSVQGEFGQFNEQNPSDQENGCLSLFSNFQCEEQHPDQTTADCGFEEERDVNGTASDGKGFSSFNDPLKVSDAKNSKAPRQRGSKSQDMKTCGDVSVYQIRESTGGVMNSNNAKSGQLSSQSFRNGHENAAINSDTGSLSVLTCPQSNSSDWGDGAKRANDSCLSFKLQNQSALDNLLKHQQMLLQKKQLQKQQQNLHQQQQQQQQHQQQQVTIINKNEKVPPGMFQLGSHFPNSTNSTLTPSLCQQTFNTGTMQSVGNPFCGNAENSMRLDSGSSHLNTYGDNQGNSHIGSMPTGTQDPFSAQGARACPRTLKASYACLDPSNPMTLMTKPVSDNDYAETADNFFLSPHFSSSERMASENQFQVGSYSTDEKNDNAWSYNDSMTNSSQGRQHAQQDSQAFLHERTSKVKIPTYDPGQQFSWSDGNGGQPRPIARMNSDSSLDCRLNSQNALRQQRDGMDSNAVCYNAMTTASSSDRQMAIWAGYQQNVNTNRTSSVIACSVDTSNGNGGLHGDNSIFSDNSSFGSSRLRQWRNPIATTTDNAEYQDRMLCGSRLEFQKGVQHGEATPIGGSFTPKAMVNTNPHPLGWNMNAMASSPDPKMAPGNPMMSVNSRGSEGDDRLFSFHHSNSSRYHHLFNNSNASSDSVGQFQTQDLFSCQKARACSGVNVDKSDQYQNPFTSSLSFQSNRMASETFDSVQGADAVSAISDVPDLPQDANSLSKEEITDQESQSLQGFVDGNKSLENRQNSTMHFKEDPQQTSSTSNMSHRLHPMDQTTLNDLKGDPDDNMFNKLSDNLERTSLSANQHFGTPSSPPWYELAPAPSEMDEIRTKFDNSKTPGFMRNLSYLTDQLQTMTGQSACSDPDTKASQLASKVDSESFSSLGSQGKNRPRMILGANAPKLASDPKRFNEADDGNRKLKEMLGINHSENDISKSPSFNNHPASKAKTGPNGQASPPYQTVNSVYPPSSVPYGTHGNQLPHFQLSGNRVPMNVSQQMQQMYCVSNIVFPPPGQGHHPNLVSAQSIMANVGSSSRLPHGMMRLPLVDMSRFVYFQPFPVNMTPTQTSNNNHNNSSSSNPHVNTSNIITINTSENDFSVNGERSGRATKSGNKGKSGINRPRPATDEFPIPVYGVRSGEEATVPKGVKVRSQNTNPWDQDLEHDFSSAFFSKMKKIDHGNSNSEVGFVYPEMVCNQQANTATGVTDSKLGSSSFMQWPMIPDMHPEMLDMLAIKKPTTDDCGTSRLCFPDMEFMMSSSKEQLQAIRKSNKPLGSNKANLISILPKSRTTDCCDGRPKEGSSLDKMTGNVK